MTLPGLISLVPGIRVQFPFTAHCFSEIPGQTEGFLKAFANKIDSSAAACAVVSLQCRKEMLRTQVHGGGTV